MALLTLLITLIAFPAALVAWTAQSLAHNRAKAKAIGLPYLVRWISPINPFWLLWGSSFVRFCYRFGIATENLTRIYSYGWEANERARIHVDLGDAFVIVHPGGIQICISSPEVIYDVLQRRSDFRRNMEEFGVLNVYEKNLSTTDDQEWQRHRKMTTVTFTEKNNEIVWQQSLSQAKGMLEYWTHSAEPIRSTHTDSKIFTLNVLVAALFNKVYPFNIQKRSKHNRIQTTIFIFGERGLQAWWLPKSWKEAGIAMSTFRSYVLGLLNEERGYLLRGKTDHQHLVARLVRACEEEQPEKGEIVANRSKAMMLTEEEIISNMFVYAFAGNDTTAIALTNLIIHLAANPSTQEWIAQEINYYLTNDASESWTYDNFTKLKRCAVVIVNGDSSNLPSPFPAGEDYECNLTASQSQRNNNPQCFIDKVGSEVEPTSEESIRPFANEILAADTSENFMPWAWGQRVCPGKRFSQVELVAVLAALFRDWRVEPVIAKGETLKQAQDRIWKASLVIDHEGHILHEMVNPEAVGLCWRRSETVSGERR